MTGIKSEELALEVLKNNGVQYEVCDQEEDWKGTDIHVMVGKNRYINVDLKGETTLQVYPKTILISIALSNKGSNEWKKPKYLERNDVWLCICDVENKQDMYILNPEMIKKLEYRYEEGMIRSLFKDGKHDYFGRDHILLVVNKSECLRSFDFAANL